MVAKQKDKDSYQYYKAIQTALTEDNNKKSSVQQSSLSQASTSQIVEQGVASSHPQAQIDRSRQEAQHMVLSTMRNGQLHDDYLKHQYLQTVDVDRSVVFLQVE